MCNRWFSLIRSLVSTSPACAIGGSLSCIYRFFSPYLCLGLNMHWLDVYFMIQPLWLLRTNKGQFKDNENYVYGLIKGNSKIMRTMIKFNKHLNLEIVRNSTSIWDVCRFMVLLLLLWNLKNNLIFIQLVALNFVGLNCLPFRIFFGRT